MFIDTIPNRKSPPAVLLRESYREGGRVKKRTLANLSKLPRAPWQREACWWLLWMWFRRQTTISEGFPPGAGSGLGLSVFRARPRQKANGGKKAKSATVKAKPAKAETCPICDFQTTPHDGRAHRYQKKKAPLSAAELKDKGLTRV
jgi:hypothetical protein